MSEVKNIIDRNREAMIIPDGIAVIGKDYKIIVYNEAASRITGYEENEIIGQEFKILFANSDTDKKFITEAISENRTFTNLSVNITHKNGSTKNLLTSITPIVKEGKVLSAVFVFRDTREMLTLTSELESRTDELIDQKNKLDAIFNSNIEGTFTIDHDWNVTSFNLSAEKITGYKRSEAIGKKCWEIFSSSLCRNGCHMEETMIKGKSTIGNELEIINKNGRKIPIRVNSAILINNKKEKIGAVETFIDISEIKNLSQHLTEKYSYEKIVGKSKELNRVIDTLESVSQTNSTVLITGESGVGKELAARAIHLNSSRRSGPFITVNCSAFVETLIESELFGHEKGAFTGAVKTKIGRFELSQGGTLFLDEIGDLSTTVQTKLLRVLETGEFERVGGNKTLKMETRIIAATNKCLTDEITAGRFREDLYYRINVINVHLPPLRERMDDFPLLVNHFIDTFNLHFGKKIKGFSPNAYDVLMEYRWPGNIRELENVIEHCFVLCRGEMIQIEDLPKRIKNTGPDTPDNTGAYKVKDLKDAEKELILSALNRNKWNKSKTALELKIDFSTLWRKMKRYNISDK